MNEADISRLKPDSKFDKGKLKILCDTYNTEYKNLHDAYYDYAKQVDLKESKLIEDNIQYNEKIFLQCFTKVQTLLPILLSIESILIPLGICILCNSASRYKLDDNGDCTK